MSDKTKYESSIVRTFIDSLRTGRSFLFDANEKPSYVANYKSGNIYTGINMLLLNQGLKDKNKEVFYVMSENQIIKNSYFLDENATPLATAIFENFQAYYKESDMEVHSGLKEVGEIKEGMQPLIFCPLYAASDVYKLSFTPLRDNNGVIQRYKEDVYQSEDGKILCYQKNFSYKDQKGNIINVQKGDPIIKHKKGSIIGHFEKGKEAIYKDNEYTLLPALSKDSSLAPLYKRKDNSGKEILIEKLCEAFRGKLMGNYKGMTITKEEIDNIEKEFIAHPRKFRGNLNIAFTRARGDIEEIKMLDKDIILKNERKEKEKNFSFDSFHQLALGR